MDNTELSSPLLNTSSGDGGDADDRYDTLGSTTKPARSLASSIVTDGSTLVSTMSGDPERGEGRSGGATDAPAASQHIEHNMSGFMLAVIIFFTMSGGPIGVEPSIRAAGNLYAIIGFAVMPILWALPEVLITTELGLRYPCASGGVRWCEEAFGPKAGLLVGYLGWVSGVANNATLPVLFLQYVLNQFYPNLYDEINALLRYGILFGITLLLTIVNYRGLEIVGKVLVFLLVMSMAPFLIMVIMGIPQVNTDRWLQTPNGQVQTFNDDHQLDLDHTGWFPWQYAAGIAFRPFINNLYWCYNGFDQGGHYSSSVTKEVFSRGMAGAYILTCSSYLVPVLIATGASNLTQSEWTAGAFATAATQIGGKWLGNWIVVGAGLSLMALFFGEMSADSLQLMGMAELGQIPSIFATRSRYNTPTVSVVACVFTSLIS
jgi:amino acid transporter